MSDQPRNVLVIMLDSQRPDVLGCAGIGPAPIADDFTQIQTPHIDRIAASGLFFDRAYAEYPITVPSRTALVSGCYTFTNRPWCPLRSYDFHIAELLREHGFATACWTDTPMNSGANLDRGFDVFDEITVGKCRRQDEEIEVDLMGAAFPDAGGEAEVQYWTNTLRGRHVARRDYGDTCPKLLFDQAIGWLEDSPQQPFFAWIDTFDPHEPWCPEPPYDTMYPRPAGGRYIPMPHGPSIDWMSEADLGAVRALYMGDVTRTDAEVGRVMQTLEDRGIADDTLVVIISDHGEPFGEHNTIRKFGVPIYDELARMVFIMKGPGVPAGGRSSALVQNVDLAPTLLAMLGLPAPDRAELIGSPPMSGRHSVDGLSLVPLLNQEADRVRDVAYIGGFGLRAGIVTDEMKLIDHRGEKPNELFDMLSDPLEQSDILDEQPQLAEQLHRELWDFSSLWAQALSWRDRPAAGR